MKNVVQAKVTMLRKGLFNRDAYPGENETQVFEPVEVFRKEREEQDAECCPYNLDTDDPQVQVVLDGAFVMVRFIDPQGANYERYSGGMDLDFSAFEDGEARAKKIADAFLG